jgi:hypothetical protein
MFVGASRFILACSLPGQLASLVVLETVKEQLRSTPAAPVRFACGGAAWCVLFLMGVQDVPYAGNHTQRRV